MNMFHKDELPPVTGSDSVGLCYNQIVQVTAPEMIIRFPGGPGDLLGIILGYSRIGYEKNKGTSKQ